ncbi:hypothetical protein ABCS02_21515 [Microbacterium sp. X-17]|uniref:hypothetical protein n=1 Tax=Microbacterium sp. X-17 TaxID=3144404 RepID=UPI0031F56960
MRRRTRRRTALLSTLAAAAAITGVAVAILLPTTHVAAAGPGAGFGTWAPKSEYGWHGSMLVDGVHTYCILPGDPAPTGDSVDHGISTSVAGLNPQQLAGINLLVSRYGQTGDAVQAASVAWAVRSIADWNASLHTYGYPGDSLRGAIHWTFSALSPAHDERIQELASTYYDEAMRAPVRADATVTISTDPADQANGSVRIDTGLPDATGTIVLENAVFTDTGAASRDGVRQGVDYGIRAVSDGAPVVVAARATMRGGYAPAIRHYTTPGGQDTAGPGGPLEVSVEGRDQTPRILTFAPTITTTVAARYLSAGSFVDDVSFASERNPWPRDAAGYLPVRAHATVYRTDEEPVLADAVPADAEVVGRLTVETDRGTGPTAAYRVEPDWALPGPGFYTAVWEIRVEEQAAETARALPQGYAWRERFGEQSQLMLLSRVWSEARPVAAVGEPFTDTVIADGPLPRDGLDLSAAVYRAADEPEASCVPERLVWDGSATPVRATKAGRYEISGPPVPDFGTYYWQERAVDAQGRLVHLGACGVAEETTRAPLPTVVTSAPPSAGFGARISDVALVSGPVPATGRTELTFSLFRDAACAELVAETTAAPVVVTREGAYTSPTIPVEATGAHFWVERLTWTPPGGDAPRELARGICGAPGETTVVATPAVTTRADARVVPGEPFADTAIVTGMDAEATAELVFSAYRGGEGAAACTEATRETQTAPVPVRGDGEYRSPEIRSEREGTIHWIAELAYARADGERVVLARGACGEAGESTIVSSLAVTGIEDALPAVMATGGALVAGGTVILGLRFGRLRRNR